MKISQLKIRSSLTLLPIGCCGMEGLRSIFFSISQLFKIIIRRPFSVSSSSQTSLGGSKVKTPGLLSSLSLFDDSYRTLIFVFFGIFTLCFKFLLDLSLCVNRFHFDGSRWVCFHNLFYPKLFPFGWFYWICCISTYLSREDGG